MKKHFLIGVTASLSLVGLEASFAGTMGAPVPDDKTYFSAFVGGGKATGVSGSMKGAAFLPSALGGSLSVGGNGSLSATSSWMLGGHAGHQWSFHNFNHSDSTWSYAPATEVEGYYIGDTTFTGHEINNTSSRLIEHDFIATYPLDIGVFLINGVLNFKHADHVNFKPYIGLGLGVASLRISNAVSTQVDPPEPGINHFNGDTSASDIALAVQPKFGLQYSLGDTVEIFGEYRLLILSSSQYEFGATVYPGHAETTAWNGSISSHLYNLGTFGIRYDL